MRNLRDGRRSRAFDNAGPRSACAPCAMDVVPWTQHPLEGRTRRRSVNRQIRRGAVVSRARSLIVRDPRRSQLRRSTWSTICVFAPRVPRCSTRSRQCSVVPFACHSAPTLLRQRPAPCVAPLNALQRLDAPRCRSVRCSVQRLPPCDDVVGLLPVRCCLSASPLATKLCGRDRCRQRSAVRAPDDAGALSASVEPM